MRYVSRAISVTVESMAPPRGRRMKHGTTDAASVARTLGIAEREPNPDLRPSTDAGLHREPTARERHALLHAEEPHALTRGGTATSGVHVEPGAVVADGELDLAVGPADLDAHGARIGVARDVRERLLRHAE